MRLFPLKYLLAFLAVLSLTDVVAAPLPDLGNPSNAVLTHDEETQLGKDFIQAVRQHRSLLAYPLLTDYIQSLGERLVSYADAQGKQFHFFVVQDSEINAFAGPDATVGVNSGLILITQTESELGAVMSHEIAHVTQDHIARAIAEAKALSLPAIGASLAALLIGAESNNPNAGTGAAMAIAAGSIQHGINFTRSNEAEADAIGMHILYRTGFDPAAMPDFFARMQRTMLDYDDETPSFLKTHPVTPVRIADAKNRATQFPQRVFSSSQRYYLMQAQLRVETMGTWYEATNYFKRALKNGAPARQRAAQYGYALALLKNQEPLLAEIEMNKLVAADPAQLIYQMGLAQAEWANHKTTQALNVLKENLELYPDNYPLILQYATLLLDANQPEAARRLLLSHVQQNSCDSRFYDLLARAQAASGHLADAYLSRATLYAAAGDKHSAILQLEQALRLPQLDKNTIAIIKAKLHALTL